MSIPARFLLSVIMALVPAGALLAAAPAAEPAIESLPLHPTLHTPHPELSPPDSLDADTNNLPVDDFISGYVIPAMTILISVPLHELGHFAVSKAVGAQSVEIVFFPESGGGIPTIAANIVDTRGLSSLDISLIAIAGFGTTRVMAEVCDRIARGFDARMSYPTFGQVLNSALFIYGRLDFPLYVLSDLVTNLSQRRGGDIDILVTEIAGRATLPRIGAYLGLLAVAGIDFYFDIDRIAYHYSIFNGNQMAHPSTVSHVRVGVVPGGVGVGYSVSF